MNQLSQSETDAIINLILAAYRLGKDDGSQNIGRSHVSLHTSDMDNLPIAFWKFIEGKPSYILNFPPVVT